MTWEEIVACHIPSATTLLWSALELEEVVDLLAVLLVVGWLVSVSSSLFRELCITNLTITRNRPIRTNSLLAKTDHANTIVHISAENVLIRG